MIADLINSKTVNMHHGKSVIIFSEMVGFKKSVTDEQRTVEEEVCLEVCLGEMRCMTAAMKISETEQHPWTSLMFSVCNKKKNSNSDSPRKEDNTVAWDRVDDRAKCGLERQSWKPPKKQKTREKKKRKAETVSQVECAKWVICELLGQCFAKQ